MARPEEGALSSHRRAQGAPMGVSQATEILNDFFARAVFRTNHQRSNPLRHSLLKKLTKLSLANQELLPKRTEHSFEFALKLLYFLLCMLIATPLSLH